MKKIFIIFIMAILFLFPVFANAAGTITGTSTKVHDIQGAFKFIKVVLTCTADAADGSFPATVINDIVTLKLAGMSLYTVGTYPGGTAPTDASDLTITQDTIDILDGKGTNLIDSTTSEITWAGSSTADFPVPVLGDLTINITGNSVNSAITTIVLTFGK